MTVLFIHTEDLQIRLRQLVNEAETFQKQPASLLTRRPAPKAWSVAEIIEHMNRAYEPYRPRIDQALRELPEAEPPRHAHRARWLPRKAILAIRPADGRRKWKMGTLNRFLPEELPESVDPEVLDELFSTFYDHQAHMQKAVRQIPFKAVGEQTIPSAIGSIIRFRLPEAFDFIISHEERHMLQARQALDEIRKS